MGVADRRDSSKDIANRPKMEKATENKDKTDGYKGLTYNDGDALLKFTCKRGKILSRRETKVSAKEHRRMAKLIKTARIHKVLPFSRVYKAPTRSNYKGNNYKGGGARRGSYKGIENRPGTRRAEGTV